MDITKSLIQASFLYTNQGFMTCVQPTDASLPSFAKGFKVDILATRIGGDGGVLVAVRRTHEEFSNDRDLQRYAEITSSQPGWRFDFLILEAANPIDFRGATELSDDRLLAELAYADQLLQTGHVRTAFVTAWSALEAAMRRRVRAAGEVAGWGTPPREMLNELVSTGIISMNEYGKLDGLFRLRNEIVHGFDAPTLDPALVGFLIEVAHRFLDEAKLPLKAG